MTRSRRTMLGLTTAMLLVAGTARAETVTIVDPGYATAQATAYVVKAVLEDKLGVDVKIADVTAVPVIWQSLARNTGEVDVWTDTWLPNQQGQVDQYVAKSHEVKIAPASYPGTQNYCVNTSAAEKYAIKSVYDLSDPEKAKVFSADGTGKGKIWIGAAGWLSTDIEKVRARDYGFAEFFDLQTTDEAVATADLDKAVKDDKAWVGYCYGPHQNFARYKLTVLQEPKHDDATFTFVNPKDPNWLDKSVIKSAYKDAEIHIAYGKSLADRAPQVSKVLDAITFDPQDVNQLAYEIAVKKQQPADAAAAWVKAHPDVVAKWLAS